MYMMPVGLALGSVVVATGGTTANGGGATAVVVCGGTTACCGFCTANCCALPCNFALSSGGGIRCKYPYPMPQPRLPSPPH